MSVIYLRDYSEANSGSRRASLHEHRDSAAVPSEVLAAPHGAGGGALREYTGPEFGRGLVHGDL